jgi:hypothetical protein
MAARPAFESLPTSLRHSGTRDLSAVARRAKADARARNPFQRLLGGTMDSGLATSSRPGMTRRERRAGWVICPTGTMRSISHLPDCTRPQKSTQNPCAKNRISLAASMRLALSRSAAKNIPLLVCGKPCLPLMHPASCRGAYASSRYAELRAAMDAEAALDER